MLIAKSLRRKVVATLAVLAGFVVFYQATIFDSRYSTHQLLEGSDESRPEAAAGTSSAGSVASDPVPSPTQPRAGGSSAAKTMKPAPWMLAPPPSLRFAATAYCKGSMTASGVIPRTGIAAADQDLLPVGSVIQIGSLGPRYDGVYTIMDTGPKVQGRNLDLYIWSCDEAIKFGRRAATVVVLRLGWNPRDTEPTLFDRLLDWGERALPGRKKQQ